jgi:acyl-CoA reductase-like NAD-dependent aldehyde dehydrogenase
MLSQIPPLISLPLPTAQVFADVKPHMRVWKEEIFGPVLSVMTFTTEVR